MANKDPFNGRRAAQFRIAVLNVYGRICHLCGLPGADTADHLIPVSRRPDLVFDISNARPAHHQCNFRRGDAPLAETWSARW